MDPRLRERIDGWETRSLTGAVGDLAEGVSGVVLAEEGHLFVHEGRIVGSEGDPERVVRTGRLHVAPAPALVLGYAMTERESETRRSYDAAETPPEALHDVLAADERTCYVDPAGGPEPRDEWAIVYEDGSREAAVAVGGGEPLTGAGAVEHVSRALEGYEVVEVSLAPVDPADLGPTVDGDPPGGDHDGDGDRLDRLEARLDAIEREGEAGLVAENRVLRETVDRLEARIEELEAGGGGERAAGDDVAPEEAIAGTNLFVRYASKGESTLAGLDSAEPEAVRSNLRLDHHTEFEEGASVEGRPFEDFLESTIEYRFVDWLVGTLPFEIRDTGSEEALADLSEAIPRIDRATFDATLDLDGGESVAFDVVAFDRHGTPLVTARCHESREPASREVVAGVEEATSRATSTYPGIAAAMVVAASYFDPDALEVVDGVTGGGGFLRRSPKRSYVTLSRNRGYHLCLVEARREELYLSTPDL
ncbi:DUF7527 domain-containing protein [Saliphagus infecundisoli]|uniref:DUF7527 domain-containing protein n=1 Tax=Saliphagus infecundisoli TaxID=1849069 RepID=A0ABD5QGF4_9EURY|nr:hypothetical protein [Saliphagus infecundisoli]